MLSNQTKMQLRLLLQREGSQGFSKRAQRFVQQYQRILMHNPYPTVQWNHRHLDPLLERPVKYRTASIASYIAYFDDQLHLINPVNPLNISWREVEVSVRPIATFINQVLDQLYFMQELLQEEFRARPYSPGCER